MSADPKRALDELRRTTQELWLTTASLQAEAALVMAHNELVRKNRPSLSEEIRHSLLETLTEKCLG
jgi:hypothetical protein